MQQRRHYNPSQPRVPKGHSTGGQWTDGNHGQATILEEGDRTDGRYRQDTILQSPPREEDGNARDARVRLARIGGRPPGRIYRTPSDIARQNAARERAEEAARQKEIREGFARYETLSALNNADRRAIIEFKAHVYRSDKKGKLTLESVRMVDRKEAEKLCPGLETVQDFADKAALAVQEKRLVLTPQQYGNAVHSWVEHAINGKGGTDEPNNPDFMAEMSVAKTFEETGKRVYRGQKGSLRYDIFENVNIERLCIHDLKTGPTGMSDERREEIATTAARMKPRGRVVVTEVRPTHPRVLRPR